MSVSSVARLLARAGRAQPGARDERVHRQDDPAMRTTGTPVGRVGPPPRFDHGIVRHAGRRAEPDSSRREAVHAHALGIHDVRPRRGIDRDVGLAVDLKEPRRHGRAQYRPTAPWSLIPKATADEPL
jgi:hypothetical protein